MLKGLYVLDPTKFEAIYGPDSQAQIAKHVDIYAPVQSGKIMAENPQLLADCEVIFSGWGMARADTAFLAAAPRLKAIFYGAGSIKGFTTDEFWERNILVSSAYAANGVPVSEYALSQIIFCLKRGYQFARTLRQEKGKVWWSVRDQVAIAGGFGSSVGIISLGMIGRRVCKLLKNFEVNVFAYDPFATPAQAKELGVELIGLDEIFKRCDVVSLHTPWLKETEGLITGAHIASMKHNASFINTSRGAVVREPEMIQVLQTRQDIQAVIDVTWPEPPVDDSPLFTLPNVVITPHVSGPVGPEIRRQGKYIVNELERYIKGQPLEFAVDKKKAATLA
jgi:phosphoglycerate dehydrogenase-like enzyme